MRCHPHPVGQVDEHGAAGLQVRLGQLEGLGLLDVALAGVDDLAPDPLQRHVVLERADQLAQGGDEGLEIEPLAPLRGVNRVAAVEPAVEVLGAHRQGAAVDVPQVVGQVGVVDGGEPLERELAVAAERALAHEVVAERLRRELLDQLHRLDDVAQALADLLDLAGLLVLAVDEAVAEDPARQRQPGRHQHRRPEGAVEPRDVLADHVDVGRPEAAEPLLVGPVADPGDVVEQGVEPDVDRLLGVERDLDPPGEPFPRDGDVLQLAFHDLRTSFRRLSGWMKSGWAA